MSALDFPTSPNDGDTYEGYVYNAAKGVWQWQTLTPSLVSLTDTTISSPASGEVLEYDGTNWVNAALPAGGKILQVVSQNETNPVTTSSTSYISTGLTASITPSSTANKIYATYTMAVGNGTNIAAFSTLFRGDVLTGTNLGNGTFGMAQNRGFTAPLHASHAGNILDSPSTTSAITYTLAIRASGSNITFFIDTTQGTLTLMEVAA